MPCRQPPCLDKSLHLLHHPHPLPSSPRIRLEGQSRRPHPVGPSSFFSLTHPLSPGDVDESVLPRRTHRLSSPPPPSSSLSSPCHSDTRFAIAAADIFESIAWLLEYCPSTTRLLPPLSHPLHLHGRRLFVSSRPCKRSASPRFSLVESPLQSNGLVTLDLDSPPLLYPMN
jgi:hypothetical protein